MGADVLARQTSAPLIATPGTLAALRLNPRTPTSPLAAGSTKTVGPFEVYAFPVPHDAADPVGYTIELGPWRVGMATDLGHCTRQVREGLRDTHMNGD